MKMKVKYLQGHFYITNFWIYRWREAAIQILDILIGFGVMAERRTEPYANVRIFVFFSFSTVRPPPPHTKIQNSKLDKI